MIFNLKNKILIFFISIFIIIISIVGYLGFSSSNNLSYKLAISIDREIVSTIANNLNTFIEDVPRDLKYLASSYSFKRYLIWENVGDDDSSYKRKKETIDNFLSFLDSKKYIYKVRYIDVKGYEQISVFNNLEEQSIQVVSNAGLQNKKMKPYFQIPLNYTKKNIYVSDLDLNKEFGEFSYPYIPVIRFSMPIIDANKMKQGVFTINIFARYFLNRIRDYEETLEQKNRDIFLIDENGFYLYNNKHKNKLWGKDLNHKISLKNENPELFSYIQNNDKGIFYNDNNLYTFEKIFFSITDHTRYWTLFTITNKAFAFKETTEFKSNFVLTLIIISIIVILLINRYVTGVIKPLVKISNHLRMLSLGEVPTTKIIYKGSDEIEQMIIFIELLTENSSNTINQVKSIASGDLTQDVQILSNKDEFGIAINNMTKILRLNNSKEESSKWFSKGLSELTKMLSAEMSFSTLSNESTSFLCRYLNMGKGVFYVIDFQSNLLNLTGSYMNTARDTLGDSYRIGEGSIGQVAKEQKPILLRKMNRSVNLALVDIPAQNSITFPLIYENKVYGVIELVSFNRISEQDEKFISKAQEIISSILYSVKQREEIESLFEKGQESQEILQNQSEELRQTNSQMEEQQQQLELINIQLQEQQTKLKEKNKELTDSTKELNEKARDLELSSKYKSEFLANMSHELRTPLNSIIILSEMLKINKKHTLDMEDVKKASIIQNSGNELLRLINDVLDLSKIEAGKMEILIDDFHSSHFLEEISTQFQHQIDSKDLDFIIEDRYDNNITTDKNKLGQIIKNFISNSLKFTKKGNITFVIDKARNDEVKIFVSDTGIGVAQEKLKAIFEAFQQADGSTSREYGGTGLGLSISKKLVQAIGGKIFVESTLNKGSKFVIVIPNLPNPNANNSIKVIESKEVEISIENINSEIEDDRNIITEVDKAFLLIENNVAFTKLIKDKLSNEMEYLLIAKTGKEGLKLARQYPVKGIILDLDLPDIDGFELLKDFKMDINLTNIPIIIYTGKDITTEEETILRKYTNSIIIKTEKSQQDRLLNAINKFITKLHTEDKQLDASPKDFHLNGKKVLVADDDIRNIYVLSELLSQKGAEVIIANNGKEAIDLLSDNLDTAIILMDIMMPVMDGYEATQIIKANEKTKHIPIIAVTSKAMSDDKDKALEVGCNDYVTKPLKTDILIGIIKGWLNKQHF